MPVQTYGLNPPQEKAVTTTDGRVLVLAGAGSGKTRVIIYRIAYLIEEKNVDPQTILGLTFTNKAAREMQERLIKLIGKTKAEKVQLSTFHSYCMKILRKEIHRLGFSSSFSLYDEKDIQRLATQLTREMLKTESELPSLAPSLEMISYAKNKNLSVEDLPQTGSKWHDQFIKDLYVRMNEALVAYNAVNFDSLLTLTVTLFEKHPDVLEAYQKKCRYILIDEYQDTNPVQNRLSELLAKKYQNLCVVGDDDQSIYGWRGASIEHILEFTHDNLIKLEQNYRSSGNILHAANAVIHHNEKRHEKRLWTSQGEGEKIELFHAPTEEQEAQGVVDRLIVKKKEMNLRWKDMAILYRSNNLSRSIEMALLKASWKREDGWVRGIPYEITGGLEFSQRSEIKDLCAYLRVIANPKDEEALLRVINLPRRGISDQTLLLLKSKCKEKTLSLFSMIAFLASSSYESIKTEYPVQKKTFEGICRLYSLIEEGKKRFTHPPLHEALKWLIEKIPYMDAIKEDVKSDKAQKWKWENVEEFVSALAQYESEEKEPSLVSFLSSTLLSEDHFKDERKFSDDKVRLMTFHGAKGLEFPVCFLIGIEDHILPHEKSLLETGVEEERRLFYVAITRAMKSLTLSMARSRMRVGNTKPSTPSRFLHEIPKELISLTSWNFPK